MSEYKNIIKVSVIAFFAAVAGSLTFGTQTTHAMYDGGYLINDNVFLNANSMSANDIQNLLVSKNSGLKSRQFKLDCYASDSKERQWYSAVGAPCDQTIPASQIIYYASRIYGINPQVILSTLQKEQSLITTQNPTDWQINQAMGYGCPTTGGCGASNFSYQIDSGTWVLRWHYERANGNMTWWRTSTSWTCGSEKNFYKPSLYPRQNVNFYDGNGTYYRTHYIQNPATSSMYCYTPHAYNNPQGLYGRAAYGTTGQYYSGSYNFVYYFELWFGSTQSNLVNALHPDGTLVRQASSTSVYLVDNNQLRPFPSTAVFLSNGYTWGQVKTASPKDMERSIGSSAEIREGVLLKGTSPTIYAIDKLPNGTYQKSAFANWNTFSSLGYGIEDVIIADDIELPSSNGTLISDTTRHPEGSLIKAANDPTVYLIKDGSRQIFRNGASFISNGYRWDKVRIATTADLQLPLSSTISYREGAILKASGPGIYAVDILSDGTYQKRSFSSWEIFVGLSYGLNEAHTINDNELPAQNGSLITL